MSKELEKKLVAGNVGSLLALRFPHASDIAAVRVTVEEDGPEELKVLAMQALADHKRLRSQLQLPELRLSQTQAPVAKPIPGNLWTRKGVVEGRKQVRLTLAALTDEDDWLAASWPDRLYSGENVGGRVRDAQELRSADLRRASVVLVRELDRRAFEPAPPEFLAQRQSQHRFHPFFSRGQVTAVVGFAIGRPAIARTMPASSRAANPTA